MPVGSLNQILAFSTPSNGSFFSATFVISCRSSGSKKKLLTLLSLSTYSPPAAPRISPSPVACHRTTRALASNLSASAIPLHGAVSSSPASASATPKKCSAPSRRSRRVQPPAPRRTQPTLLWIPGGYRSGLAPYHLRPPPPHPRRPRSPVRPPPPCSANVQPPPAPSIPSTPSSPPPPPLTARG